LKQKKEKRREEIGSKCDAEMLMTQSFETKPRPEPPWVYIIHGNILSEAELAGGFLNALGPNCSWRQKGQEAGAAAGARAANIVTDGQLLLFNFFFFSRGISLRPDELS
jgi:hypothetical protein